MGSVIDYIECPRCKQKNCFNEYYYKTGEEYINCPDCGYIKIHHYKKDINGKYIKKDQTKGYEFVNLIPEEIIIENPYGSYYIQFENGNIIQNVLENVKDYVSFISEILLQNDLKKVYVSKLVDNKIEKEIIIDNV